MTDAEKKLRDALAVVEASELESARATAALHEIALRDVQRKLETADAFARSESELRLRRERELEKANETITALRYRVRLQADVIDELRLDLKCAEDENRALR